MKKLITPIVLMLLCGVALAQVPDPVADPGAALSMAQKLYHSGAWLCLGIVVVFVLLDYLSKHVGWLKAPNRAHYVAIALAGLATLAVPASQGTTPNLQMIIAALGASFALVMPGTAKPAV